MDPSNVQISTQFVAVTDNQKNQQAPKKNFDETSKDDIIGKIDRKLINPAKNLKLSRKNLETLIKRLRVVDQLIENINNGEFKSYESREKTKEYSIKRFWKFNFLKKYSLFQGAHRKVFNKISSRYSLDKNEGKSDEIEKLIQGLKEKKEEMINLIKNKLLVKRFEEEFSEIQKLPKIGKPVKYFNDQRDYNGCKGFLENQNVTLFDFRKIKGIFPKETPEYKILKNVLLKGSITKDQLENTNDYFLTPDELYKQRWSSLLELFMISEERTDPSQKNNCQKYFDTLVSMFNQNNYEKGDSNLIANDFHKKLKEYTNWCLNPSDLSPHKNDDMFRFFSLIKQNFGEKSSSEQEINFSMYSYIKLFIDDSRLLQKNEEGGSEIINALGGNNVLDLLFSKLVSSDIAKSIKTDKLIENCRKTILEGVISYGESKHQFKPDGNYKTNDDVLKSNFFKCLTHIELTLNQFKKEACDTFTATNIKIQELIGAYSSVIKGENREKLFLSSIQEILTPELSNSESLGSLINKISENLKTGDRYKGNPDVTIEKRYNQIIDSNKKIINDTAIDDTANKNKNKNNQILNHCKEQIKLLKSLESLINERSKQIIQDKGFFWEVPQNAQNNGTNS